MNALPWQQHTRHLNYQNTKAHPFIQYHAKFGDLEISRFRETVNGAQVSYKLCSATLIRGKYNINIQISKSHFYFFSFLAEANQTATKTIIEAVIADRGGTENCPWSPAEMKGNCTSPSIL